MRVTTLPILASLLAAALAAAPAAAQQPSPGTEASPAQALEDSGAVRQSQEPEPSVQGVRSPKASTDGETAAPDLQTALTEFYRAPPDVQGNRIQRPNEVGSNPDMAEEPTRSENPSDLSSQETK